MKLLVTGTKGQVARSLIEAASQRHIDLVALGRPELDLTDPVSIKRELEKAAPDFVINAAAYTAVDKAEKESEEAMAVNGFGAGALAAVCKEHSIPLIHLSTDYVFDGTKPEPYKETDIASPLGIYGHSKLEGEKAVIATNPQHIILRTAWVYSPFGNNFVKTMIKLAETRDELNIVGDQHGCPSYAPHIATGILDIIEHLHNGNISKAPWGIYNMAGSGETTWNGFAQEIFDESEKHGGPRAQVHSITTAEYPTPAKRPANSRLDCSKLTETFNITMPDWRQGTADCVTRLLAQPN